MAKRTADPLVTVGLLLGNRYRVVNPSVHFPHDFQVVAETVNCIRLKNSVEEYNTTRTRFESERGVTFEAIQ